MSFRKFLTQKELEAALEEAIDELEVEGHEDVIDAVYLPPDVYTLTDEENIDDENYSPENEPTDIAGTFKLQVPNFHHNVDVGQDEQDEWSSSDEEDLASKRKRLAPGPSRQVHSKPKWVTGEIDYTHSAKSKESDDKERIQNELAGKTPLEIFHLFLDEEILQLVTDFSLKYAQDNNRLDFRLTKNDLLNFMGRYVITTQFIFVENVTNICTYHALQNITRDRLFDYYFLPVVRSCTNEQIEIT